MEVEGGLSDPVEGAGNGNISGSTRKVVVEQLEKLRGSVLMKFLAREGQVVFCLLAGIVRWGHHLEQ